MTPYQNDLETLRGLAKRVAEIAALPVQRETKARWSKMNDLKQERPMVLIWGGGIPWNEMQADDELALKASDPFLRDQENTLRQTLYRWNHLRGDMVVEPFVQNRIVIRDVGGSMPGWDADIFSDKEAITDPKNIITSKHFKPYLVEDEDIEKIKPPILTVDEAATEDNRGRLREIYEGILEVRQVGVTTHWFWPWNNVSVWLGLEETLLYLHTRPDFVHRVMQRVVEAELSRMDQLAKLGVLHCDSGHSNIATGGYAYTKDLPSGGSEAAQASPGDQWGSTAAEIFTCVSPEMHQEFALDYEIQVLKKLGLTYYGCCEALHHKMHLLEQIPNLRKVSVSAWSDPEVAAERIGKKYVFSYKPDASAVSRVHWDAEAVKKAITGVMRATKKHGCNCEIILNASSTVCHQPGRLLEWEKLAMDIAGRC